jgi:hypothetical protein
METSGSFEARSAPWPYPANDPLTKHRKDSDDTKTGVSPVSWEQHGRYLLTVRAVSGVQAA